MLIKELEDMLVLVRELPRDDQLNCVRAVWKHVEAWEERQQHSTGNTWSGRGRMARWLKDKQDAGEDIEKYRT